MRSDLDQLPRFKPEYAWLHEAWVEALESGNYSQTTGTLRDDSGHCCLGVLKDVAAKNGSRLRNTTWKSLSLADNDLAKLTGTHDNGRLDPLTTRNDGVDEIGHEISQQSFKQIARIIRNRMAPEVTA